MRSIPFLPFFFLMLIQVAQAASATATLQMIWPDDMLGIDRDEALNKATLHLQSADFAEEVAKNLPRELRKTYTSEVGILNTENISAVANAIKENLNVLPDKEQGDITLTFTCDNPNLATELAQIIAKKAVGQAHYKIAEKMDPKTDAICQEMESIRDQMQTIESQKRLIQQQMRTPANQHGANIGAPIDMGRVVNPQGTQDRMRLENLQSQMQQLRQQYAAKRKELTQAVNTAWKGKPKAGLVIIDHADLDA